MGRMQSTQTDRTSFTAPEWLIEEIDELAAANDQSRSSMITDLLKDAVDADQPDESAEYLPEGETMRNVYTACVEVCRKPEHLLRWDMFGGAVAQQTSIAKSDLGTVMHLLDREGYVRELASHPMDQRDRKVYRVKPRCADPEQWSYSRLTDRDARATGPGGEARAD